MLQLEKDLSAVLLTLCGLRGLDFPLPFFWHEQIQASGKTGPLFPRAPPTSLDLERLPGLGRLLGWACSPDALQAPQTWLVQQEPDPIPVEGPGQLALQEKTPSEVQREPRAPPVQAGHEELSEGGGTGWGSEDQTSQDVPLQPPISVPDESLEVHWQDLLALLEPPGPPEEMTMSALGDGESSPCGTDARPHLNPLTGTLPHESALLPLTPSGELDDHPSLLSPVTAWTSWSMDSLQDASQNLSMGLHAEDHRAAYDRTLTTQDDLCIREPKRLFQAELAAPSFPPGFDPLLMAQSLVDPPPSAFLLHGEDGYGLCSPLTGLLEDATVDGIGLSDCEVAEQNPSRNFPSTPVQDQPGRPEGHLGTGTIHYEPVSSGLLVPGVGGAQRDSGLSLGSSRSPASEDEHAEANLNGWDWEVEEIKQEAVGGCCEDGRAFGLHKALHGCFCRGHIGHDHTYTQSSGSPPSLGKRHHRRSKPAVRCENSNPYQRRPPRGRTRGRDGQRAQSLRIPFPPELIVDLSVEDLQELLSSFPLTKKQLLFVRDIRRRGKNKIAAHNCRKRKQQVLLGLEQDVSRLRRQRSQLLRQKKEALRDWREMQRRLGMLHHHTSHRLWDEKQHLLPFGPAGSITSDAV
ncbi:uncharacterized protein ACNS7B_009721 [Menidia menidia]